MKGRRRLIVISDLHLGGKAPYMMSHAEELAKFIGGLSTRLSSDQQLELVINGDFIDFLALEPWESWPSTPDAAAAKLAHVCDSYFDTVFNALSHHLASGHRLTILLGNHDIELALPTVQTALLRRLGVQWPDFVRFVDDGSAWQVGGVLIEHGNRYDPANRNDWERLRAARSQNSRGEAIANLVRVSPGSKIVTHVLNPLKTDYPFLDLVQPQGELLALLLLALEPSLALSFRKLAQALRGAYLQARNPQGNSPGKTHQVGSRTGSELDPELESLFGDDYRRMRMGTTEQVGLHEVSGILSQARKGSLKGFLSSGQPIPPDRLTKLRALLRRLLPPADFFTPGGDPGPCGEAAKRIRAATNSETILMGHTHLARSGGPKDKATYINTGTWADLVTIPEDAVTGGQETLGVFEDFLRRLWQDQARIWMPTYADVQLQADGAVMSARLCKANE